VSIQRGEPLKTAYHVCMLVLQTLLCDYDRFGGNFKKIKNIFLGWAAANFGAGGDANLIHFFIWPKGTFCPILS
jgi:hypothetical protein